MASICGERRPSSLLPSLSTRPSPVRSLPPPSRSTPPSPHPLFPPSCLLHPNLQHFVLSIPICHVFSLLLSISFCVLLPACSSSSSTLSIPILSSVLSILVPRICFTNRALNLSCDSFTHLWRSISSLYSLISVVLYLFHSFIYNVLCLLFFHLSLAFYIFFYSLSSGVLSFSFTYL